MNTDQQYLSEFGEVLLFIIGGSVFIAITLFASRLVRPNRPSTEKLLPYESGEEAIGSAWSQFNVRFYIVALIFLLFEIELIFLFPWALVFSKKELIAETDGLWSWFALVEAVIFIGVLAIGLAYAWVHGHLDWMKPNPKPTLHKSPVPREYYQKINEQYAGRKAKNSAEQL